MNLCTKYFCFRFTLDSDEIILLHYLRFYLFSKVNTGAVEIGVLAQVKPKRTKKHIFEFMGCCVTDFAGSYGQWSIAQASQ